MNSQWRSKTICALASVLTAALAVLIVLPADAENVRSQDSKIAELTTMTLGATEDDVRQALNEYAIDEEITAEEALDAALAEQSEAIRHSGQYRDRSSESGKVKLPTSYHKSDIYFTQTAIGAGHVGIYGDTYWVVEASGPEWKSDWYYNTTINVMPGANLLEVNTTQGKRDKAADYAYKNLRHRPYNLIFWNNKKDNGSLNCSQLVWLAYSKGAGIDLDGNGGKGVYPIDIFTSSKTRVNWVVR
ncbi:hypothetical protein [Actinomyces vulturis]|uniref:hypothetical protein n=1 Tax=Actinomyces vulturis TaxID=1857645 RepID=UPI0008333234|nr:hypothetical protein [Actinomyces vulturis]